jgi:MarR family 2-MHQ and catechol resistance regulon transcriptional repressor
MRAAESVTRRTHGHLADHDLTIGQFGVLEALLHLGPLRQCELAEKLLRSPANLTTVLDNLERRGSVERRPAPDDRRAKTVHLTRPGRRLIERVFPTHADGIARDLAVLGAAGQRELARLCKQLGTSDQKAETT